MKLKDEQNNDMLKLVEWGRYLCRASMTWEIYKKKWNTKNKQNVELLLLANALLYVCIEAYKEYKFKDEKIDYLLGQNFCNLINILKRFRNTIFHPDKIQDIRQIEFYKIGNQIMPWTTILLFEFERYLYFKTDYKSYNIRVSIIEKEIQKIGNTYRRFLKDTLGWLPNNSIYIKVYKSTKKLKSIFKYKILNEPDKKNVFEKELNNEIKKMDSSIDELYLKLQNMGKIKY
jgi:hypothetical protein